MAKTSVSRKVFVVLNYAFFVFLMLVCVYPLWYVFITSVSNSNGVGQFFYPQSPTFSNYLKVFKLEGIGRSFVNSISRTVLGTSLTTFACMLLGYLFSKPEMPMRKLLYRMLVITMYLSGGLIPTYLIYKSYGLLNNFFVYILPSIVSAYYVILTKTYVEQLPASVEESAMLDGATTMRIFLSIIIPMSLPIIATIAVYSAVAQWNAWFDNHIYTFTDASLETLQYKLYNYLKQAEILTAQLKESSEIDATMLQSLTPKNVRMTVTVVVVVPVLFVYPFLQRYFVKGIMIGAVKG